MSVIGKVHQISIYDEGDPPEVVIPRPPDGHGLVIIHVSPEHVDRLGEVFGQEVTVMRLHPPDADGRDL